MSLEQAIAQTIAHCQAGQWQQAEVLYHALKQTQTSLHQGQHWLGYIDALIKAGKPRLAPQVSGEMQEKTPEIQPEQSPPADIRPTRPPNPGYTAKLPRWPWKMALGNSHAPGRSQIYLLLAHYRAARYAQAEALARSLAHAYPRHALGWKVLVAALQIQGRTAEAEQARQQRRSSRASYRKNRHPGSQGITG